MALSSKSLILYGFEITTLNRSLDFKNVGGGPELQATLTIGFYSLTELLDEIVRAMEAVDPGNLYFATVDRSVGGGLQNRVTIGTTTATTLQLLFGSGSRTGSSIRSLIGFNSSDYTGGLSYQGSSSAGTAFIPAYVGFNYLGPDNIMEVQGAVTISANGIKESLVYQIMEFIEVQFKYEPKSRLNSEWRPLVQWMIQQRAFEFTPEISSPTIFYEVTLENSTRGQKGMGFQLTEMLPSLPNHYETGKMVLRKKVSTGNFII